jgi:phosphoglycolate phosphatase
MQKPLPIDLLIFDLDGTLTDSIPSAVEAVQEMLLELGLPMKSKAEINSHVGFGEIPLISGSISSMEPELLKKAMLTYEKIYIDKGLKKIPFYPNTKDILKYYDDKLKVILSNKKDMFIKIILENHGLSGTFAAVLGGDTSPCLKPDPCAIVKFMNDRNIKKDRALMIGDMTVDIETGKNAGIHTCAVTYGFDNKETLKKLNPDFMIDDILELKGIVS